MISRPAAAEAPTSGDTGRFGRARRIVNVRSAGSVVAQLAQALTSFVLQMVAVRALGAEGFGVFALVYSGVVLATAASTGLVGDSLTVLDRDDARIRGGLQILAIGTAVGAGIVGGLLAWLSGLLPGATAAVVVAATTAFLLEDLVRRTLMASLDFWRVVVIDCMSFVVTIGWIVAAAILRSDLRLVDLFAGIAIGQFVAGLAGVRLLPVGERWLAPWRGADVRPALRYGTWRGLQQGVRPVSLTVSRAVIVAAVGALAFGQLEAARVYTAPVMLVVNGAGAFFFASFAANKSRPRVEHLARADTGATVLALGSIAVGLLAVLALPLLGDVITGGDFELGLTAVLAWLAYSGASSFVMPYGILAAVSGSHVAVLVVRMAETVAGIACTCVALFALDWPVESVPVILAVASLGSAVLIRQQILAPGAGVDA